MFQVLQVRCSVIACSTFCLPACVTEPVSIVILVYSARLSSDFYSKIDKESDNYTVMKKYQGEFEFSFII